MVFSLGVSAVAMQDASRRRPKSHPSLRQRSATNRVKLPGWAQPLLIQLRGTAITSQPRGIC
jgi:hypothetical protein